MTTITPTQLRKRLAAIKHAQPIAFTALTTVDARKTGNPYSAILKLSTVQAFISDHESSVNRQQQREGQVPSYKAGARSWGRRESLALVTKGEKAYLSVQVLRSRPVYMVRDGALRIVPRAKIEAYLPATKPKSVTTKEVVRRDFDLKNVVAVSIGGERLRIRAEKSA